jgi:hypothetical protein
VKTGRKLIIQALVALGAAGTIAASVTVPAVAAAAPGTHVHSVAAASSSWYHA